MKDLMVFPGLGLVLRSAHQPNGLKISCQIQDTSVTGTWGHTLGSPKCPKL